MYRVEINKQLTLATQRMPVFYAHAFLWIAPDRLLNARTMFEQQTIVRMTTSLVRNMCSQSPIPVDAVMVPSMFPNRQYLCVTLDPDRQLFFPHKDLTQACSLAPPFDSTDMIDRLLLDSSTRLTQCQRV